MQSSLVVIGLNYRTASVGTRERFWMGEVRAYEALLELSSAPGIEEVIVLATCNRSEFIMWTGDFSAAANSLVAYLTRDYGLQLEEWQHFYQLLDEDAVRHVFRVASGLDSMAVGEPEIVGQLKAAWARAQKAETTGRFLDTLIRKALTVSKRTRNETALGQMASSIPYMAVRAAKETLGTIEGRNVLVMGAGKMSTQSARALVESGVKSLSVINRTYDHARCLAEQLGGTAAHLEDRWPLLVKADIVICSTGCPHFVMTRDEVEQLQAMRNGRPLFLVDLAVPRDIDPSVRGLAGVFLCDVDDLSRVVTHNLEERRAAAAAGEEIVAAEAREFYQKLAAEHVVPTIVAFHDHLVAICAQEQEKYRKEVPQCSPDELRAMETLASRLAERIASSLAKDLKKLSRQPDREHLASALSRLFHLETETIRCSSEVNVEAVAHGLKAAP